jgi:hypothetical protein
VCSSDLGLGTITIELEGSASAVATPSYNKQLSERRVDAITDFLKTQPVGDKTLEKFFNDKKIVIKNVTATGEDTVIPIMGTELGADGKEIQTENSGTGEQVRCMDNIVPDFPGPKMTKSIYEVYATNAMACRRVKVKKITVIPSPVEPTTTKKPDTVVTNTNGNTETLPIKKPEPTKSVIQKIKEGISKKILRNLLSECDYFEVIEEKSPMLYDSIKQKIKYFNPAFHSMTPEGLNARLTFLNQCVRPGETIPIIGSDGKPKVSDAVNSSFGAPPILVLRIGDFYHTKIVPETISFSYDPLVLDMNPEGIGLQPMIAKVTLSFKMIGGMGLAKPVEQLQNALSFNFYGNTEIYDERATWTEDTSALDKMVVDAIIAQQPPTTVDNTESVPQTNDSASTIGEIKTTVPLTPSGETGEISYMKIMDKLLDDSKTYFNNTLNSLTEIVTLTNYGILQTIIKNRQYSKGNLDGQTVKTPTQIFGKPANLAKQMDELFNLAIKDVESNTNPIMFEIEKKFKDPNTLSILHSNIKRYLLRVKEDMLNSLNGVVNTKLGQQQVDYVQDIRKVNVVVSKTDGKILDDGSIKIYNLTETDKVSASGTNTEYPNTYDELIGDFTSVAIQLESYLALLSDDRGGLAIIPEPINEVGKFTPIKLDNKQENQTFFMVIGRLFMDKNKVIDFNNSILTQNITTTNPKLKKAFEKIVDDLVSDYSKEIKAEEKVYEKFKKDSDFLKFTNGIETILYKKGKSRIFNFDTTPNTSKEAQQKTSITNLYKGDPDFINKLETFDGKIKFN